jgi:hypothetical protein
MAETFTADSVGVQVTQILDEATVTAAELLAEADQRADRAGRDELANLRNSLEERIDAVRDTRARLAELSEGTTSRLRTAASQLAEMPSRLAVDMESPVADSFDRAYEAPEPPDDGGPPAHLAALMKAADEIAEELTETARRQAKALEHAARREVDRVGLEEPKRVARAYDPTARRAEQLRREVEALNKLLDTDVMGADQTEERTQDESALDEQRRAALRGRRHRR